MNLKLRFLFSTSVCTFVLPGTELVAKRVFSDTFPHGFNVLFSLTVVLPNFISRVQNKKGKNT